MSEPLKPFPERGTPEWAELLMLQIESAVKLIRALDVIMSIDDRVFKALCDYESSPHHTKTADQTVRESAAIIRECKKQLKAHAVSLPPAPPL